MNLRNAALLLIIGLVYNVLYKLVNALFPSLRENENILIVASILWLVGAFTIILFVFYFLKGVAPLNKQIKISLYFVVLFTCIIIVMKLPLELSPFVGISQKLIFNVSVFLNSLAMLVFFISYYKIVPDKYSIKRPIKMAIWAFSVGLVLGIISIYYYVIFFITGKESEQIPFVKVLAMIVFIFTYYAVIEFLIKFRKTDNYAQINSGS